MRTVAYLRRALIILAGVVAGVGTSAGASPEVWENLEQRWREASQGEFVRMPGRFGMGWHIAQTQKPVAIRPAIKLTESFTLETWFRLDDPAGRSTLFSSLRWRRCVTTTRA